MGLLWAHYFQLMKKEKKKNKVKDKNQDKHRDRAKETRKYKQKKEEVVNMLNWDGYRYFSL